MSLLFASRRRLACLLVIATWPVLASAQTQNVTVTVNTGTAVRTVDERVFGINAVIWDREAGSSQTVALLQQAGIRTIRIPGGSLSDVYHWRLNKSIDTANGNQLNPWVWWSGMHKFASLITGLEAQAFVTVNYGSGTPEEAAAWVAYANAATTSTTAIGTDSTNYDWQDAGFWARLRASSSPVMPDDDMNFLRVGRTSPYGLKYWEIGNECYGQPWEVDLNSRPHDPQQYAERAKLYIEKMKAVDPTIRIGVVVTAREDDYSNGYTRSVRNQRTGVSFRGWTPVMLTRLSELGVTPDMVIYHRYEQGPAALQPSNGENDAGLLQKAKTWPDDAAAIRRMVNDYLGATEGAKVEIVVTENNSVYSNPGKQTTSLVNGLFLADSIGNILQTEINALMWWDTRNGTDFTNNNSASLYGWRNYGDYGVLSSPATGGPSTYFEPYPTYYALKLLSRFARHGDTVVSATSNNSLLSVFAVKPLAGGVNLLVINKDPANPLTASITVNGFTPASSATLYSYGKPQDDAAKPGGSGSPDLASSTLSNTGTSFTATFASYSMSVIALTQASSTPTTPTTPTTPPSSGGGGGGRGGGGGAPSVWFAGALVVLLVVRGIGRR
ncbi:MAG: alpha-L-arabinofuranosidase [Verrucomicrobiota bacterium]